MVRKLRGEKLTIPNSTERDVVTLYHRHSIEEIEKLTGMRRIDIQRAVLIGIKHGEVAAYATTKG